MGDQHVKPEAVRSADTPYDFAGSEPARDVRSRAEGLEPGGESSESVAVAGRIMLSRPQGRLAFATLRDWTGEVQLFALERQTEEFEAFTRLNLGDWIGVRGEPVKTRRGEPSVRVREWVLLARARRPFGDKWRGVTDPETRYRQREVDLWANPASREVLLRRSRMTRRMRERLWAMGFVEVETPIFHRIPGGAHARPFVTHYNALDADVYLRIAPELYLKRLVVGGIEKVFELGRVFRNEGLSYRHNPEFTMLEVYQAYVDYRAMMALTEDLVAGLAEDVVGSTRFTYQGRELDLTPPWRRATMAELVSETTGVPADVRTSVDELRRRLLEAGGEVEPSWGPGKLLLELFEKTTEKTLWDPVFVCDYPVEVSPLARRHRQDPELVERFEPYIAGREIGNGFSELNDPDDQRVRFEAQAEERAAGDEEAMVVDEDYLRALEHGLPPTGGLGIGVDRLAMLFCDCSHIREVIAFPMLRAER